MTDALAQADLTGALTDLIMGLIMIPMIICLFLKKTDKIKQKKLWICFFVTLDVSCLLGFTVHYYCKTELSSRIVWIPLFILLYEVFVCFFLVALSIYTDGRLPDKKITVKAHLVSLAAFILTHIIIGIWQVDSIRLLTVYNTPVAVISFVLIFIKALKKGNTGEKILFSALIPMLPAGYFQIQRNTLIKIIWYFNHNGLTHLLVILSVIILFVSVLFCLDDKKQNTEVKKS